MSGQVPATQGEMELTKRRLDVRASMTAQINAAQRAAETLQPPRRRLIHDPLAKKFVHHPVLRTMLTHRVSARLATKLLDLAYGGLHAHIIFRARYAEDLLAAAGSDNIDQVVLLGAGFDSSGLRSRPPLVVYEVDAPATQSIKRSIVDGMSDSHAREIRWVSCDFEIDNLRERLHGAGFDPSRRSLFIWLGVTFYLELASIEKTLDDIAALTAPGSRLLLDYAEPGIVDGTSKWSGARRGTHFVARFGEPYKSGFSGEQIDNLLLDRGFQIQEHARLETLQQRYSPADGTLNRPGKCGGSRPWKRGWSHAEGTVAGEAHDTQIQR